MLKTLSYRSVIFLIMLLSLSLTLISADLSAGKDSGIGYIPTARGDIAQEERQTSVYHHNNSLDQLWYGTDRWAVKFDLSNIVNIDSFRVETVNIFFPQGGDSFNLQIYTDQLQPLDSLAVSYSDVTVNQGWNDLNLPADDQLTGDLFWIVIEYATNPQNRYMGASAVGGENSYFWVPPQDVIPGFFANMAETGIVSEFLAGIAGTLYFPGFDLELLDFSFEGNFNPGGNIYPVATIRNNSTVQVEELVGISVRLDNADPEEGSWIITIPLDLDLMPGEETSETFNMPQYSYRLLGSPAQYRLRAELQHDDDLFTENNLITFSFDNYAVEREGYLIENFLRSAHQPSLNIINAQQTLAADSLYFINYFFHPQDVPYYNQDATIQRDFYSLSGYPFTIIEGNDKIAGYSAGYADTLTDLLGDISPKATFLSLTDTDTQKAIDPDEYVLELRFSILNNDSFIFSDNLSNLRMFMALIEKNNPEIGGAHLIHMNRYQSAGALQLGYGAEHSFYWMHSLQSVGSIYWDLIPDNFEHFEIIYWLQDSQKKDVHFVGSFGLDEFDLVTSVDDEFALPTPEPGIRIFPNPLGQQRELRINLTDVSRDIQDSEIRIYNIKGQLIKQISTGTADPAGNVVWNGIANNGQRIASGIYLARIEYRTAAGQKRSVTGKFVVLPQ